PLIGDLNLGDALALLNAQLDDVKEDLPELRLSESLRSGMSGEALGRAFSDVLAQIQGVRAAHDSGLVRARLLSVLGHVYSSLGEYERAGNLLEEGVAIARGFGEEGGELLSEALRALAWTYRCRGRAAEAIPLCQEALELDVRRHGGEHVKVATSLNHLATMQRDAGLLAEARANYGRALAMREKLLGADHQDFAFTLYHYASLLRTIGEFEQARDAYERAATIFESTLGPEHLAFAWCQSDLSKTLSLLGEVEASFRAASRALEIRERVLPEGHPDFADAYLNLGSLSWKKRDFPEAVRMFELALGIQTESLGRAHPDTIRTLARIGVAYGNLGKSEEAESCLQEATDLTAESGEVADIQFAADLQQLGNLQARRGATDLAKETLRRALEAAAALPERVLSRETSIRFSLASLLDDESEWLEALEFFEQVLADRRAHPEWTYPDLNRARFRCAELMLALDRLEDAEALLLELMGEVSAIEGFSGVELHGSLWMLAQCYLLQGRKEQAADYFDRSLSASRSRSGPEACGHLFLEAQRAAILGDEAEAVRLFDQSVEAGLDLERAVDILGKDPMRDWPVMRALRERLERLAQQSSG
ncbi:MAG: tetratricopeptide repeat protein, partial [Planctomycetota bacterium]